MTKIRALISAEINRLQALKESVQAQIETTRTLLQTQKGTLDTINQDIDDARAAFKQLGGGVV